MVKKETVGRQGKMEGQPAHTRTSNTRLSKNHEFRAHTPCKFVSEFVSDGYQFGLCQDKARQAVAVLFDHVANVYRFTMYVYSEYVFHISSYADSTLGSLTTFSKPPAVLLLRRHSFVVPL
ncbi:MAG: hypothetical protein WB869_06670 [Candidatus Acidiferrales bacterium]